MHELKEWNLKDVLPANEGAEFEALLKELHNKVDSFAASRNKLTPLISETDFLSLINLEEEISILGAKLGAYAYLWFSTDTTNEHAKSFMTKIEELGSDLSNKMLFFHIWFKDLDEINAKRLIAVSGDNKYHLESVRRFKQHTLTEIEEKIISIKNTTGDSAITKLYTMITSKFVFPLKINGKRMKLNVSELTQYVRDPNPVNRENAYNALWKTYSKENDILGEIYKTIVLDWKNENLKLRNYKIPIHPRNLGNDIPDEAIDTLITVCKKKIGLFQRYFELKRKIIGLPEMSRYHIYAPVKSSDEKIEYDSAVNMVLDTFNSFSPRIAQSAKSIFDKNHIDSRILPHKKSGAYCYSITPNLEPYILANYTGKSRDVATLAHELGHAVHSILAKDHTILTFHAPLPLAETASIFGEMLLSEKLLEKANDKIAKQDLLCYKLDDLYASIIRQIYFIIFEQKAHEAIANGATISELNKLYLGLLKEQFGKSVKVPKQFALEWNYIPHIYESPFYCYAYAFGNLLTLALFEMYKEQGQSFVPKYIELLASGGSKKPQDVLAPLGIDICSEEFWEKGFKIIEDLVNELEEVSK